MSAWMRPVTLLPALRRCLRVAQYLLITRVRLAGLPRSLSASQFLLAGWLTPPRASLCAHHWA
jgi:hypothetical protein